MGHLVDVGCAPHFGAGVLAVVRRLPDAAPRHRRADAARHLRGGLFDLCFHRRAHRHLLHQVVAHAASAAGVLGRWKFPARLEQVLLVERAGHRAVRRGDGRRPPAAGRIPTGTRLAAPHGARHLRKRSMTFIPPFFAQISVEDLQREALRLQHDYTALSYGLTAAWVITILYVLTMVGRERKLKREIAGLKAMLEDRQK